VTIALPPLVYTLCFLTHGDDVLMLLRVKPPNRGLWNGVGGKIDPGEDPTSSVLREVQEETGYVLPAARFCGLLTWGGYEVPRGGLYIFTAPAPAGEPHPTPEGLLAWKPRRFVFTSGEVVSNIHHFGPLVLDGAAPPNLPFCLPRRPDPAPRNPSPAPGFHV